MEKSILIAGVNGFVGKHLVQALVGSGHKVHGAGVETTPDPAVVDKLASYSACDLADSNAVKGLPLAEIDAVINLAGLAQVGASFDNPDTYMHLNVAVHEEIAKALQIIGSKARVLCISTGAVYDNYQTMPLTEDSQLLEGGSPYAQSKIAMEKALQPYIDADLDIVIARPFNHIGPGQRPGFLVPDLSAQITAGGDIQVGNLKTKRDYTDVRDVVQAYVALATQEKLAHRLYNVCSGKSVAGEAMLAKLLKAFGKQPGDVNVIVDTSKIRPNDPEDVRGSNERLRADTDWQPQVPVEQTIKDFVAGLGLG